MSRGIQCQPVLTLSCLLSSAGILKKHTPEFSIYTLQHSQKAHSNALKKHTPEFSKSTLIRLSLLRVVQVKSVQRKAVLKERLSRVRFAPSALRTYTRGPSLSNLSLMN
jgi:hypothetical protein